MPVLRGQSITLTPEEIIASPNKSRIRPAMLQSAKEAIALGQSLWQPSVLYDWFDVVSVDGQHVTLSSQQGADGVLHVGRKADLLAPAQRAVVSAVTLGPALEEKVDELQSAGDSMMAYLLDSAGVVALGHAGESLRCLIEETAVDLGWGVSPSLSPGSLVGWSLRGQRELCALLPLQEVGLRLTAHSILQPHKSATSLIGLGPGYDSPHVGSVCKYCALQDTCWRKREDST
jgi:hypothetical protein